jgi:probable rRNA maturation factor
MRLSSAPASVEVSIHCDSWLEACPDAESLAATAARAALAGSDSQRGGPLVVAVILTNDGEQQRLNCTYRGIDKPTNVLAFALTDPLSCVTAAAGAPVLLGDVVLAFETTAREAAEQHKPLARHLSHLVVHGVLHLLGCDHENATGAAIMEAREVEILTGLGVPDPYRDTI